MVLKNDGTHNVVITINIMSTSMATSGYGHIWKSLHWSHHVVDLDYVASIIVSACHHNSVHKLYTTGIPNIK